MTNWWTKYKVRLPLGTSGNWSVKKFTVSKQDEKISYLRAQLSASALGRWTPAGTYIRLVRDNTTIMSDTPDEISDHIPPILYSKGKCLVNGLGLGVVIQGMLRRKIVEHVTVVEISKDVIDLVGKVYQKRFGKRLTIVNDDAFEFKPPKGQRYEVVWHDIWDNICLDNLPEMTTLKRKYGRRTNWQGAWSQGICRRRRKYEENNPWFSRTKANR